MKRSHPAKPANEARTLSGKRIGPVAGERSGKREAERRKSVPAFVRVYSPFRCRVIDATPEQARISRQVWRTMDLYKAAKPDLARRAKQEWNRRGKGSLLGDLEMLESTISGVASWCEGVRTHPDPAGAIKKMFFYDIPAMSRRLGRYPQLQRLLLADMKLREMVVEFLDGHRPKRPR